MAGHCTIWKGSKSLRVIHSLLRTWTQVKNAVTSSNNTFLKVPCGKCQKISPSQWSDMVWHAYNNGATKLEQYTFNMFKDKLTYTCWLSILALGGHYLVSCTTFYSPNSYSEKIGGWGRDKSIGDDPGIRELPCFTHMRNWERKKKPGWHHRSNWISWFCGTPFAISWLVVGGGYPGTQNGI